MISVIGSGPAGCFSALSAIEKGYEVEIFESQNTEKRRVQCSGLVSKSGIDKLGIPLPENCILNKVRGARLFSPSGKEVVIDGKETKAYVLDRRKFDNFLLNKVISEGAAFNNEKVSDLEKIKADRIILATGTNYNLQRKYKLQIPKRFLIGAQYGMELECDKDFVELYFNVPGFFSWVIPAGEYARIGLCSQKNPVPYLESFLEKLRKEGRIKNGQIHEKNFGIIPIHDPKMKTDYGRIGLVGDAAAHVKATTGGGIILGCIAAKFSTDKDYEKKWKKAIGKELQLHYIIRNFLDKLSDRNMERLFSLLDENKDMVEKEADMDLASKLISSYAKKPLVMLKFLSRMPYFLGDLL